MRLHFQVLPNEYTITILMVYKSTNTDYGVFNQHYLCLRGRQINTGKQRAYVLKSDCEGNTKRIIGMYRKPQ